MTNRTRILLWTDTPGPYIEAIAAAGLEPRVAVESLGRATQPSEAQMAETEVILGWGAPAGLLTLGCGSGEGWRGGGKRWRVGRCGGASHWGAE